MFAFLRQRLQTFRRDETRNGSANDNEANDSPPRRATFHHEYLIATLLNFAKQNPNLTLLDVGCGSGSLTFQLAKLIPNGTVTGVDISGAILESAKVHAEEEQVSNVGFIRGDVHSLPFADASFDVVHTHQSLAHFHDHAKAIAELARVTKRNGLICVREGDLTSAKFSEGYEVLDECFQVIIKVHEANGGTVDAGRRLKGWMEEAGVRRQRIVATKSVWVYDTLEGRREYGGHWPARCMQGVFAERAGEVGVTRERLEEYAIAWKKWIEDSAASLSMEHGEVVCSLQ